MAKLVRQLGFASILLGGSSVFAQIGPWADTNFSVPRFTPDSRAVIQPVIAQPCAAPADLLDMDEYDGPLNKLVARFSQKLEIKTVTSQHHKHARPCSLDSGEKFHLFVENSFEPVNFLSAAWDAAWAQRDHDDPSFHQGAAGFGKEYLAQLTDNIQGDFFNTFAYPAIFHQDPRYYRLGHGTMGRRLVHAVRHVFVAHSDSGGLMFNFSEWLGTASSKALSNVYHPGNDRSVGSVAQRTGMSITTDMGFDILREFWPEIAHKFHLPFKPRN
jgi:hypothetical protein